MDVPRNASSLILPVRVVDDDGNAITGIAHNDASLTIEALKHGDSAYASVTLAAGTLGTYVSGGWVELGGGYYQFCPPNGLVVEGRSTAIRLTYATNKPQDGSINAVGSLSAGETSNRIALDIVDGLNNWSDAVEEWATQIDILLSVSHGAGSWEGDASADAEEISQLVLAGLPVKTLTRVSPGFDPVTSQFSLVQGDDYVVGNGAATDFEVDLSGVTLAGASVEVGAWSPHGGSFRGVGSLIDGGIRVEWSGEETAAATPGRDFCWQAKVVDAEGLVITKIMGPLILVRNAYV